LSYFETVYLQIILLLDKEKFFPLAKSFWRSQNTNNNRFEIPKYQVQKSEDCSKWSSQITW